MNWLTLSQKSVLLLMAAFVISACGGGGAGGIGDNEDCTIDVSIQNFPLAYVQRPAPTNNNGAPVSRDYRDVANFSPGAVLYVKKQATACSEAIDVTSRVIGNTGDVKGVEISRDGTKVLFSMREEDGDPTTEETWNIWEYDIPTNTLNRVITSTFEAEQADDLDPYYLADGRIIFTSTRQRRSINILRKEEIKNDVNKLNDRMAVQDDSDDYIFNLHVMNEDGSNIRQITFNQGHDLEPSLMDDGRVLFTRWDQTGNAIRFNLYTMNPDGTNLQLLYGKHSHNTGTGNSIIHFTQPREMQDGRISVLARQFNGTFDGGDILAIDTASYVDIRTPIAATPTLTGPAQVSLSSGAVRTTPGIAPDGRYASVYPLWDGSGRLLVSWSACLVNINNQFEICTPDNVANPAATEVAPRYGLYIYNPSGSSIRPLVTPVAPVPDPDNPGQFIYQYISDAAIAQDRPRLNNIADVVNELSAEQTGVIHIRSVYDFGHANTWNFYRGAVSTESMEAIRDPDSAPLYTDHPARFIRIVKAVSLPSIDDKDLDPSAFGVSTSNGMREIVGYVTVEPDGSAKFKVPADVPVALSVLDEKGRRISNQHNQWIIVRNRESIECIGCHTHQNTVVGPVTYDFNNVHGRREAEPDSRNTGAPVAGESFTNTLNSFDLNIFQRATMAEARYPSTPDDISQVQKPNVNIDFIDAWTDPAAISPPAIPLPPVSYTYNAAYPAGALKPVSTTCNNTWEDPCRIIINYEDHIAPLWSRDRGIGITCIECHTDSNVANAGNLDLDDTNADSNANDNFMESYAELFIEDDELAIDGGGMVSLVYIDNITGNDTFSPTDATGAANQIKQKQPSMSINGAMASYFMQKLSGDDLGHDDRGNTVNHAGFMTPDELKVVAEWLDIGGQYFNNPFDSRTPTE